MRGVDVGSLRLETMGSSNWTQLWSRTGEQGSRGQWILALVVLPQDTTAIRFVGTTGLRTVTGSVSYMSLDAIGLGLPLVDILRVSCTFSLDTCLWYNAGASSWQLAGQGGGDRFLEATRSGAQGQEYILQTAAVLNTTEEKFLVIAYQLSGSDSVALELQHKSSAGDWQLLLSDSGPRYTSWHQASVVIPSGTVALRLVANITDELDVVRVESFLVVGSAAALADISCGFEGGSCNWTGPWLRHSGNVGGQSGPLEAFSGEHYVYMDSDNFEPSLEAGVQIRHLQPSPTLSNPPALHPLHSLQPQPLQPSRFWCQKHTVKARGRCLHHGFGAKNTR